MSEIACQFFDSCVAKIQPINNQSLRVALNLRRAYEKPPVTWQIFNNAKIHKCLDSGGEDSFLCREISKCFWISMYLFFSLQILVRESSCNRSEFQNFVVGSKQRVFFFFFFLTVDTPLTFEDVVLYTENVQNHVFSPVTFFFFFSTSPVYCPKERVLVATSSQLQPTGVHGVVGIRRSCM